MTTNYSHKSVFPAEILEFLKVKPTGIYLDSTLGDGGHTLSLLESNAKVISIDQDPEALDRAHNRLKSACPDIKLELDVTTPIKDSQTRCLLIKANFSEIDNLFDFKFDGIIFDLGVSTVQILKPERGFTFSSPGPLDMRMSPDLGVTAADLVNALSSKELTRLISDLSDETYAAKIADQIVKDRKQKPITTTTQLADLISEVKPIRGKTHPATKTFQALRMAVNLERESLEKALPAAINHLKSGGRLVMISFHSGEDRIIKHFFRQAQEDGLVKVLTSKPVMPTETEINSNPRARSAKLRAVQKI